MSDDLRTRIIAALLSEDVVDVVALMADAVIKALADDIRANGTWAVIDLLAELAGPRCFADAVPTATSLNGQPMSDDYPHTCGESEATCAPCFAASLREAQRRFIREAQAKLSLVNESVDSLNFHLTQWGLENQPDE